MKNAPALPAKVARAICQRCGGSLPETLLRPITVAAKDTWVCRNEAACRRRQRQRTSRAKP